MPQDSLDFNKRLGVIKKLKSLWFKTEAYRFGFLLGTLSIGATLVLVFAGGKKKEGMVYKTKEISSEISSESAVNNSQILATVSSSLNETPKPLINLNKKLTQKDFSSHRKINVNKDPIGMLVLLPKIGPSIAGRIIQYREKNGPFKSLSDLDKVKGIGPKILETIKDLVEF